MISVIAYMVTACNKAKPMTHELRDALHSMYEIVRMDRSTCTNQSVFVLCAKMIKLHAYSICLCYVLATQYYVVDEPLNMGESNGLGGGQAPLRTHMQ